MCYLYKCEQATVRNVGEKSTKAVHICHRAEGSNMDKLDTKNTDGLY